MNPNHTKSIPEINSRRHQDHQSPSFYDHLRHLYKYMPNTYNSTPENVTNHSSYIGGPHGYLENAIQDLTLQDSMCVDGGLLSRVSSRMSGGYESPRYKMDGWDSSSMIDGITAASNPMHLSNAGQKESGQLDEAQSSKPTESIKDSSVPIESRGIQKTPASKDPKTRSKKSKSKKKPSSKHELKPLPADTEPVYHIMFDGFDEEEVEPVGHNCTLCATDLSRPIVEEDRYEYYEDDEYMMPAPSLAEVAVLPCGHAFHNQCLQFITPQDLSSEHQCCSEFLSSII